MLQLPGPSRIPTFGTRIPQFGSTSKAKQDLEHAISSTDVGKFVLAAGKVGTLRFVGKVHFATGVWCGVELDTDVGKNDGCIDGIRYFSCSRGRGLMTPLSKVSILNDINQHRIPENRKTELVSTSSYRRETLEDQQVSDIKDGDVTYAVAQNRTHLRLSEIKNVLNTPRSFDIVEKDENKCFFDKNDNKASSSESSTNNNSTKKRNSILVCSSEKYFHSPIELKNTPNYMSTPVATTSRHSNGNSLLLVTTLSKGGSTKIESCEELFEKGISNQIFSENSAKKTNELMNLETFPKKSSQILDSKEKLQRETVYNRHSSSSGEDKDQNTRTFIFNTQEEENKRDSLDLDESLEILSVSQMNDGFSFAEPLEPKVACTSPLSNANFDHILQENVTLICDTTINLELTLDTIDKSKNLEFARLEETPSPEELPLDPIPIVETEQKSESTKSKSSSFITSITSITSLDTGYQGDGEMSRPGSRGADNSPLTRRPLQRPPPRRTDAMTDSDFFTESDADNHDENILRGDRKAQVIDGTLYGVDPQAAADIYVNNRENMDSSGIFTDIESNTRTEELLMDEKIDISPTDTSSKTLSENSQNNLAEVIAKNLANNEAKKKEVQTDTAKKRGSPSPVISNTSSTVSPRHLQRDDSKKYKTLKREVQSKVKMLMETSPPKVEKKTSKKPVGRWDAVMNKISKSDSKMNFQEVKSRAFNNVNTSSAKDVKKIGNARQVDAQKSPNNKLRRVRTRLPSSTQPSKNSNGESIHSSLSDISTSLPKKTMGKYRNYY
ncbi:hypothetical protein HHI36_008762 [Cryptolaemus montrouzieri]|uniref:CAP-Gly domain-containing protein n=1 Tax=Cryptolaemus montrouzieri TaxID=559131 RepID=A0ABD2MTP8_9CUCU